MRTQPVQDEVFDRNVVTGNVEYFFGAPITGYQPATRIVLPPPELGCIEGQLQTIFALLLLLALDLQCASAQ